MYQELINPEIKIPPDASAIHHITSEMVQSAKSFNNSFVRSKLDEYNSNKNTIVGHNIMLDLALMQNEGFVWQGGVVDTLKCSKEFMAQEIEKFSLQFLRYELKLYRDEQKCISDFGIESTAAYDSLGCAFVTKMLYRHLLDFADADELIQITANPVLISRLSFGKYRGRHIEDIVRRDSKYLNWMLGTDIDDDLRYSIEFYIKEVNG